MKSALARMLAAFALFNCLLPNAHAEPPLVVQGIECRGNAITSCDFIRDRLYLAAGNPVDEEEIGNAKLRLSSLPNFTVVNIFLEKGGEKGHVLIIVEVTEADPWTKESVFATASRGDVSYERIAGRISNENLWGTGKVISLEAGVVLPISGFTGEQYYSRLLYADPRLFDSKKYFLIGSARYNHAAFDYPNGGSENREIFGVDLTIGRRIFDFSYVTFGYFHNSTATHEARVVDPDGTVTTYTGAPRQWLLATYGWNTEDDPFFPTRGSRAQVSYAGDPHGDYEHLDGAYRHTWKNGNSIWTVILGTAPGIVYRGSLEQNLDVGFSYGRGIAGSTGGEIRRGRWYIEPGQRDAGRDWEVGVKAGIRLETKSFGIVDVYFFGSKFVNPGGDP